MNIPQHIKIGHLVYDVHINGSNTMHDQAGAYGVTNHEHQVISLDEGMSEERQAETFLHELIHCAFNYSGLSNNWKESEPDEEHISKVLGGILYTIIKENGIDFT